jgi:hypothetical protein
MSRPWKNFGDITQDLSGLRFGLVEPSHPKQRQCNEIAHQLNTRPRKRLAYQTPLECFNES